MKFFLACLLSIAFAFNFAKAVQAHVSLNLPSVSAVRVDEALSKIVPIRFLPSKPLYFSIRLKETFLRMLKPSAVRRAEFDVVLCGKRVKEAYLTLVEGDIKNSSRSLRRYSSCSENLVGQVEKARTQNQDIANLVNQGADALSHHQALLIAIYQEWQDQQDSFEFDENFTSALESFEGTALALDKIKPGVKDRFLLIRSQSEVEAPYVTPPFPQLEATPSAKPKRIIY